MSHLTQLIQLALTEDIGRGDVTTEAIFRDEDTQGEAILTAKQDLVLSGLEVAEQVFKTVDSSLTWQSEVRNSDSLLKGAQIATIIGSIPSLLKAERIALNFLQHLSGIATLTHQYVRCLTGTDVMLRDTRKTTPGYRELEKAAVRHGGAANHRMGLHDAYLIKDNHIDAAGSITEAVKKVLSHAKPNYYIQVEVRNEDEIEEAVKAGAQSLILDNMTPDQVRQIATKWSRTVELEVSGGVTLDNLGDWAASSVHIISVGAITHSAPAVDISMLIKSD